MSNRKAPEIPPVILTEEEQAERGALFRRAEKTARMLRQRNLDNAVLLAQEAARGRGELVDYFAELGRRFGSTTVKRPKLRIIEGRRAE